MQPQHYRDDDRGTNSSFIYKRSLYFLSYVCMRDCVYLYVDMHAKFPNDNGVTVFPEAGVIGHCKLP